MLKNSSAPTVPSILTNKGTLNVSVKEKIQNPQNCPWTG